MEAEPKAARRSRSPSLQGLRESRAEMTPPPRRMVMRHGGGTECERGVFRAKRKRERVSATPIERHQEVAEERGRGAEPSEAQRHEGAGEPAVDTCCLISAVAIRKAPSSPRAFCD